MTTPDMFTDLTHPENVSRKDAFLYTSSVKQDWGAV
jgi:hypothetical protein